MSFFPAILLAILAFAVAAFMLRLPRGTWALFGAGLMFGLTGYALQGSPGQAGSPAQGVSQADVTDGEALVETRRAFFDPTQPPSRFVTVSDGFSRRGQFADAAGILRGSLERNDRDAEAWVALGNALVEHTSGQLTPAAIVAYSRAEILEPENPAIPFFLGVALIRSGRLAEARALWADTVARAPADAEWRPAFEERLARLDALMAQAPGQ